MSKGTPGQFKETRTTFEFVCSVFVERAPTGCSPRAQRLTRGIPPAPLSVSLVVQGTNLGWGDGHKPVLPRGGALCSAARVHTQNTRRFFHSFFTCLVYTWLSVL